MKKSLRFLSWIFLPPLVLVGAFCLVLATESGFRLLVGIGDSLSGPLFSAGQVRGHLLSSWQVEKVQVHVAGVVHVELEDLSWSWKPGALFHKDLHVSAVKARGLMVRLEESGNEKSADEKPSGAPLVLPEIHLPFGLQVDDLQVHDADIFFSGSVDSFPVNELILQVSAREDQVHVSRLKLESPDYGGDLQARVRFSKSWPLELNGKWRVADPGIGDLHGSVKAGGNLDTLAVSVGTRAPAVASVEGQLTDLLGDLHWKASVTTEHLALSDLKVDVPVDGTLTLGEVSGTLQTYGGTLAADLRYEGYPQVQVRTEVEGDYTGLTVHSLYLLLDQIKLTTSGQIGWVDGFSWQAELEGTHLDPSLFSSEWPGQIDTLLHSQGRLTAGNLAADLKIDRLQGKLRGYPLAGSGSAQLDGKTLIVDELHLQSGATRLQLNGRANSELDFVFQAASDDLASLWPAGSGIFQMQGTVGGRREEPRLAMSLAASELKVDEYALQNLKASVNADLSSKGRIDADVEAGGVRLNEETISKMGLKLQGNLEKHQMDLSLFSSLGSLQLALAGGVLEREWQGEISKLLLQSDQFGEWQTEQAAELHLAEKHCELKGFSLRQDQVGISLTGNWQEQGGWQVQGGVDDFSLKLLEEWGLLAQTLDGIFTASLMAGGQGTSLDQAEVTASVPDLSLRADDEDGNFQTWQWTENALQVVLKNGEAQVTAKTRFQDGSVAELAGAVGNLGDFTKPEEMSLDGNLDLDFKDLSPLTPLSNYMVNANGRFTGTCAMQGTVAKPVIRANMALKDGDIKIPDAGISLQKLELSVAGDGTTNKVALDLASGEGKLRAEGIVRQNPQKQWQADFTIKGKDFQGVDLTEYKALISPDLRFVYEDDGATLSGTLTVPKAHIAPIGFQGSVSSSQDVVLVDENGEQEKGGLPLSLDLTVALGKDVKVDAFGLKGNLDGQLEINQDPGQAVTGLGNLNLRDGTFTFSDTTLAITRGLVFYQGGHIDDPGLDVRARKTVQDMEVGVQVTGSVSRMEINLFSDPVMDDSDILAYILMGRSMSNLNEKEGSMLGAAASLWGVGKGGGFLQSIGEEIGFDVSLASGKTAKDISLVVGKEIYKDLYISYGKGLSDSAGTFQARYDLKYGFSVKTEATSEATGADLLWSLER
ncbi:MAG: translocation/assembly module TamB domain-containing protein [Proteobacteria bacterium]|nr:translocation/assembly module TamB domain-containing protein [Pseudomonadota bacterium]